MAGSKLPKLNGFKKRQLIADASRTMFLWVVIASVAASICLVTMQFLYEKWAYNNRLINAKAKAANILKDNITNAQSLKTAVDDLVGNQDLSSVKTNPSDSATKSILDALPSTSDTTALATSLQQAILSRSGVSIESITVPAVAPATTSGGPVTPQQMKFSFTIDGTYDQIHHAVLDMERTIRPISIQSVSITGNDSALRATFEAVTYYQPATSISITKQVVK